MKHKKIVSFLIGLCLLLCSGGVLKEYTKSEGPLTNTEASSQETEPTKTDANNNKTTDSQMKVHYINTGQSDCILIESGKEHMLIDAGEQDDVEDILSYLKEQKINSLKYLILTHPHADHIGAASQIIDQYTIGKIIMPSKTHTTKTFQNVLSSIKKKGLKITKPVVGNTYALGDANFTIIAPNKANYGSNLNDYSVGIRLVHGNTSFLFIGDAELDALEDILKNGEELDSDVLLCGHHGSETSTTKEFLTAVSPKFAIISTGKNSYGHPSKETLSLLDHNKITYYRTDKLGTILATSQNNQLQFYANGKIISTSTTSKDESSKKEPSKTENSKEEKEQAEKNQLENKKSEHEELKDNDTVYITNFGTKYHKKGCRHLNNSAVKTTVKKAKAAGYEPCGSCIK